jgi:TetR/AcrR family transcriptional repressor of mexJK operon
MERRGRPPSAAKRAAILEAATTAFLKDGYTGTNLDDVAAAAEVSKQTVYRHFTDKKSLFIAAVEAARQATTQRETARVIDPDDIHGSLVKFGEHLLDTVMSERVAALRRVMIGELGRIPELKEMWSAGAPQAIASQVATELANLTKLDIPDAAEAAEMLFGLLTFRAQNNTAYGVTPLQDKDKKRMVASAVDLFVRAYQN